MQSHVHLYAGAMNVMRKKSSSPSWESAPVSRWFSSYLVAITTEDVSRSYIAKQFYFQHVVIISFDLH
jgi:hypothetical protein